MVYDLSYEVDLYCVTIWLLFNKDTPGFDGHSNIDLLQFISDSVLKDTQFLQRVDKC